MAERPEDLNLPTTIVSKIIKVLLHFVCSKHVSPIYVQLFVSGLPAHLVQGFKGGKCCHRQGESLQDFDQLRQYSHLKKCMTSFSSKKIFPGC